MGNKQRRVLPQESVEITPAFPRRLLIPVESMSIVDNVYVINNKYTSAEPVNLTGFITVVVDDRCAILGCKGAFNKMRIIVNKCEYKHIGTLTITKFTVPFAAYYDNVTSISFEFYGGLTIGVSYDIRFKITGVCGTKCNAIVKKATLAE